MSKLTKNSTKEGVVVAKQETGVYDHIFDDIEEKVAMVHMMYQHFFYMFEDTR
jgi:hypothetical protein